MLKQCVYPEKLRPLKEPIFTFKDKVPFSLFAMQGNTNSCGFEHQHSLFKISIYLSSPKRLSQLVEAQVEVVYKLKQPHLLLFFYFRTITRYILLWQYKRLPIPKEHCMKTLNNERNFIINFIIFINVFIFKYLITWCN